jgi:hypothetical protein
MQKQVTHHTMNTYTKAIGIMRTILQVFLFLWSTYVWGQTTPISDTEARAKYDQCWKLYETGEILKCYNCSVELRKMMGRPTGKVNNLIAASGPALLPHVKNLAEIENYNNNATDKDLKITYKTIKTMHNYIIEMIGLLQPEDTLPKHKVIREKEEIMQYYSKLYDSIKNQKPEELVRFLNACAEKFKRLFHYNDNSYANYIFRLDNGRLIIDMNGKDERSDKPKYRGTALGRMEIDLKNVWIEEVPVNYITSFSDAFSPFAYRDDSYMAKNNTGKDKSGPVIKSTTHQESDAIVYDHLLTKSVFHFDKNLNFPQLRFDGEVPRPAKEPLYIFQMFDQRSRAFLEGAYRTRIREAFEMLIEHFGGGSPK